MPGAPPNDQGTVRIPARNFLGVYTRSPRTRRACREAPKGKATCVGASTGPHNWYDLPLSLNRDQ